jgi:hypothetical protein
MNQKTRILVGIVILIAVVGIVLGVDSLQRKRTGDEIPAGSIPIYVDGEFIASFIPDDLDQIDGASFVDDEEGKTQEGWLLVDILLLYLDDVIDAHAEVVVSSSSREKDVTLIYAQVADVENMVMFDLSGRGTLKLVSKIPGFDTRDDWVQDVDKIEIHLP